MEINLTTILITIVNLILLCGIIIVLFKAIKGINRFAKRNKELDKKVDDILKKLDNRNND